MIISRQTHKSIQNPSLSNIKKVFCQPCVDNPIKPNDLDHLLEKEEDIPMDMVKDPKISSEEESAPPTLKGEMEDNIKAPATEK